MAAEKTFENRVKKFLESEGCFYIKYWAGSAFTKSGIPDLLICCNGHFLGVEIKSESGRASELQKAQINRIIDSGGIAFVLKPSGFEEFKKMVRGLIHENKF